MMNSAMLISFIHDGLAKLVSERFGLETWELVQKDAGVPDCESAAEASSSSSSLARPSSTSSFSLLSHRLHEKTLSSRSIKDLIQTASQVTGHSSDDLLEALGEFLVHHLKEEGCDQWLSCPGKSLRDWLSNLNVIQQHLEAVIYQSAKQSQQRSISLPRFYCAEKEDDDDGSLVLHCCYPDQKETTADVRWWSNSMIKGMVSEVAGVQFGVEINMNLIREQKDHGALLRTVTWSLSAANPNEQWKLYRTTTAKGSTSASTLECMGKECTCTCPHTGMSTISPSRGNTTMCGDIGISGAVARAVFPYHIIIDSNFIIQQVGNQLARVFRQYEAHATNFKSKLVGAPISNFFSIEGAGKDGWSWQQLSLREHDTFFLETRMASSASAAVATPIRFRSTAIHLSNMGDNDADGQILVSSSPLVMLILNPAASDLEELGKQGWTLGDIPVHSAQQELILARDHLSSLLERQKCMEQLGQSLERERNLLESLLPTHVAEGLRAGETVQPLSHDNVTFFFSDVVGFTSICHQLFPWQVIEMLNHLYSVCDFLATRMDIFKIETIGDAYVCCSGLPKRDDEHARKVANFAIAVNHCCRHVKSPVDGAPIQMRIGVNSGRAVSGVVGSLNPRFCVFGDTVNTAARHESSGLPGRIHCSGTTKAELEKKYAGLFNLEDRGKIGMKGKGELTTYWLEGSERNDFVNRAALERLDDEVKDLLCKTNFKTKMGLDAHHSFISLRQEREIQGQALSLSRNRSGTGFGSSRSSLSTLSGIQRTQSSVAMSRSGSKLRVLGSTLNAAAKNARERNTPRRVSADTQRQGANAEWGHALVNSASTGSDETRRQKNGSSDSLHLLDLQTKEDKTLKEIRPQKRHRRAPSKLHEIAESCMDAVVEDSMSSFMSKGSEDFPAIPDCI